MIQSSKLYQDYLLSLPCLSHSKRAVSAFLFCLPTSLFALLLLFLLACNGFSVFYIDVPLPSNFSLERVTREKKVTWLSSSLMHVVKEEDPPLILKTHLPLLHKPYFSAVPINRSWGLRPKGRLGRQKSMVLNVADKSRRFSAEVKEFFKNSKCKSPRFFMTWISSIELFGKRELLSIESLFKSHPNACLLIVSNSLDSRTGRLLLSPFLDKGFKLIALKPDFDSIFKNTPAKPWFSGLKKGNVDAGEVSLGQNLSNLLRLALLYKFGGVYIDADVMVLKSFNKLRNVIGAQAIDLETKSWSRLNNAVLIFDKQHPLLYKFIQEFALTFNGNKWGHNGPYLVSRVVSRVSGRAGYNFTVLPPPVFYPVDWSRIQSLFQGPRNEVHSKWLRQKLQHIRRQSFVVHLWNRQSRKLIVKEGSIMDQIMSDCCIFCNFSRPSL
ncbi:hypothetical protein SLE2022_390730 [Rubroshorea leprosula]